MIVHDQAKLLEAAKSLISIDQAGELPALGDEINAARRDWKRSELNRSVGEKIYVDQLAKILTTNGIDANDAWSAICEAVRPSWQSVMLSTIIDFAVRMEPAGRRA